MILSPLNLHIVILFQFHDNFIKSPDKFIASCEVVDTRLMKDDGRGREFAEIGVKLAEAAGAERHIEVQVSCCVV